MTKKLSSQDRHYRLGKLSAFPQQVDNQDSLYHVRNNAETVLKQTLTLTSKYVVVEDAGNFPSSGLLKLSPVKGAGAPEAIYYGLKIGNQFHQLQRGFAGFRESSWPAGSLVSLPVMADHHNALMNAIIRIEQQIGLQNNPEPGTINGILTTLEKKWLAPRPTFKAYPKAGPSPLTVRFQNLSPTAGFRFLWNFGDGTTSTERSPLHTYVGEGTFNVQLTMIAANGASGIVRKPGYVEVHSGQRSVFFYASPLAGVSKQTVFELIDQSEGDIVERHWFFGDGTDVTIDNANEHAVTHTYDKPGKYRPSLLLRTADDRLLRASTELITVD